MAIAALSTKNPYYISREIDWIMARDAYGGERYIKEKGQAYLPPTAAHVKDGMAFGNDGARSYEAYKQRAVYHELVKPAVMAMLGVMHRKPPTIELPAKLDSMRTGATFNGEGLPWLLQKINEQQMLAGRIGLLADVATGAPASALPYIVPYLAEQIINWDSSKVGDDKGMRSLQLVVLNETDYERRAGLAWIQMMRFRVLAMAGDVTDAWPGINAGPNEYVAGEVRHTQEIGSDDFTPISLGGRSLDAIPFVFIGPRDLVPEPDIPVVMPLVRLALAIYRTEADYRQALYMQGQDTLVVVGQQADANGGQTRTGAFGAIDLPAGGDAFYIGAESGGIRELGQSIQDDLKRAAQLGAQLLSERGNEAESGQALGMRMASRTATLTTIANAGAGGLEQILRHCAKFVGADPDQVSVQPNMDFADDAANAQDAVYLMTAKGMGMPISNESIHGWLARKDFTNLTYEEEKAKLDAEPPAQMGLGTPGVAGVPGPIGDVTSKGPGKSGKGNAAAKQTSAEKEKTGGASPAGAPKKTTNVSQ